jgi:ribokinase
VSNLLRLKNGITIIFRIGSGRRYSLTLSFCLPQQANTHSSTRHRPSDMAQARVRLTPAGRTPAATFLSGSNPRPAHLTFFPKLTPTSLSAAAAANAPPPHIVVVGSANADIYVEVDRLPLIGETVAARAGRSLAGGKGANQAACGGRLALGPTYLVARVGDDANGRLLEGALADAGGVRTDRVARAADAPSGHAVVMLMPDGQNSIIIVGGANMEGWAAGIGSEDLELIRKAGVLLLQREIPDWVNAQAAQVLFTYLRLVWHTNFLYNKKGTVRLFLI